MNSLKDSSRHLRAPHGTELSCRSWQTEAALRMLLNNLDPEAARRAASHTVYFITKSYPVNSTESFVGGRHEYHRRSGHSTCVF